MGRGKLFQCEITVSSGVKEKLSQKHDIEIWEIEEIVYDDPNAFSIKYQKCYFVYGQTSSGRYLLVLVRILESEEIKNLRVESDSGFIKIITAREMNEKQRKTYRKKKGAKS
ncbi:MAG: hypothetical protein AB1585_05390 [Thermodesulfobacteriota bacterium]